MLLEIRAQNMTWSPRQPLLALESTRREAYKGKLWPSTLTEPLQLLTYFRRGNAVPGGSSHAAGLPVSSAWGYSETDLSS